jgi:hypothetical protein
MRQWISNRIMHHMYTCREMDDGANVGRDADQSVSPPIELICTVLTAPACLQHAWLIEPIRKPAAFGCHTFTQCMTYKTISTCYENCFISNDHYFFSELYIIVINLFT